MSNLREQAISALKTLAAGAGMSLTENDSEILEKNEEEADKYKNRLLEISTAIYYGFIHCAAEGVVLVPESKIKEQFGYSVEENYPEANEVFLKFATTYWTLRILSTTLAQSEREWIPTYLLRNLEQNIGSVFFPFPGKIVISPSRRERTQRELLQKSGANINIEEFIRGNPILIRDRGIKRGCLGTALLWLFCFILICCMSLFLVLDL